MKRSKSESVANRKPSRTLHHAAYAAAALTLAFTSACSSGVAPTEDVEATTAALTTRYEAESATYTNCVLLNNSAASGGQYLDGNASLVITWTVNATAGSANLAFATKNPSGTGRKVGVFVNGTKVGVITTDNSTPFATKTIAATLLSGSNTIQLQDSEGTAEPDIDYLEVTPTCVPTTCAALGATCGTVSDTCGGTLSCGTGAGAEGCDMGQNCSANACVAGTAAYYNTGMTLDAAPDFGPNVKVYTPATPLTTIRDDISAIYQTQRTNQFGPARNAVLFTPGTYNVLPITCAETDQTTATNLTVLAASGNGSAAFDNNAGTSWDSAATDPQSIQVDMGAIKRVTRINLVWGANSGKDYTIQVSSDGTSWSTVATKTAMAAGARTDDITITGKKARFVKMVGTARTTTNGYSIQEMNVYGDHNASCDLAAPLPIGFNTEFAGLGDHPDATDLNGRIIAPPDFLPANNGTQTFWRALTNFKSSYLVNGANHMWAVSQAAPMRRVHTVGSVDLHVNYGWESGGYIADSSIDGFLLFGSQQQFYTRNSFVGTADSGSWNITFQGSTGTRAANEGLFPAGSRTEIPNSPVVREKPFLYVNRDGKYNLFAPAIRTNAVGPSWTSGQTQAGTSIPMSNVYIAKSATDTATTMNAQLAAGKHLIITPGIYHLSAPLAVNNANTVVLGMGMATLVPDNGVNAINVADVDGVKIAGLILDAGTTSSAVLLQVGPVGSSASHASNPTSIHDIFSRIGGGTWIGKAAVSIQINSKDAISDHIWLWRADHSDTANVTGWSVNTATNGLVVNGANVNAYGNFVEHFQQYEVLWNGENGKLWFLQNEHPYDAPSQAAYMNGTSKGWAAYKVADAVTTHLGTAISSYAVFTMNACTTNADCDQNQGYTNVCASDGFCTPPAALMQGDRVIEANAAQANVKFDNMVSLSLTAKGKLNNMVNSDGLAANAVDFNTYPKLDAWH